MAHAEHSVTVDRPIEQVFAYLADEHNDPRWRSGVLEIERVSAQTGQGATIRQVMKGPGGRRIRGDYRITAYQPPRQFEFQVIAGPARPTGRFSLSEDSPGHTRLTFAMDAQPKGLMRLMEGMIAKQLKVEVAAIDRLKANVEQQPAAY